MILLAIKIKKTDDEHFFYSILRIWSDEMSKKEHQGRDHSGLVNLVCPNCGYHFDMEWKWIFDIQELIYGYIGFHTNDVYFTCPKCEKTFEGGDEQEAGERKNDAGSMVDWPG